jgi:hypothetical protein
LFKPPPSGGADLFKPPKLPGRKGGLKPLIPPPPIIGKPPTVKPPKNDDDASES